MKQAAAIGKTFRLDPVAVLNGTLFEWQVRTAAYNVVAEAEKKAMKKK